MPNVSLSSRELVTRFQLDSVMQSLSCASSALAHFLRVDPATDRLTPCETEARISVENAVHATCERLAKIMADDVRWSLDFQIKAEQMFEEAQKLQVSLLTSQNNAAEEITSPHFRYRPTILRLVDGSWAAFLGNLDFMEQGVIGVGKSPAEAIEAFDAAWKGVTSEKVLAWAKEREQHLEKGEATQPFPIEQNETKTLDGDGNQGSQNSSREGENDKGNRSDA